MDGLEMTVMRFLTGAMSADPAGTRVMLKSAETHNQKNPAVLQTIEFIRAQLPSEDREITREDLMRVVEELKKEAEGSPTPRMYSLRTAANSLEYALKQWAAAR